MEYLFVSIICAVIASMVMSGKGRSGVGGFFLGLLLSVVGVVIAVCLRESKEQLEANQLARGDSKKCPSCLSIVPINATACRFCGRDV